MLRHCCVVADGQGQEDAASVSKAPYRQPPQPSHLSSSKPTAMHGKSSLTSPIPKPRKKDSIVSLPNLPYKCS